MRAVTATVCHEHVLGLVLPLYAARMHCVGCDVWRRGMSCVESFRSQLSCRVVFPRAAVAAGAACWLLPLPTVRSFVRLCVCLIVCLFDCVFVLQPKDVLKWRQRV